MQVGRGWGSSGRADVDVAERSGTPERGAGGAGELVRSGTRSADRDRNGALAVGALPARSAPPVTNPVTKLRADDADEVPLERLEARICSLAGRLAASTCEWLRLIAEFDRRKGWAQWGVVSCAHWLSWACSVAVGAAREYVRVATALVGLPLLDAAFAAGRLSYSKVRALTRVADRIDEQTLLDQGLVHTASQLERVVRGYRKAEGIGLEQRRRRRARWFWDEDGMLVVSARLTADEGAIVVAALQQAQQEVFVSSRPCAANGEEPPASRSMPVRPMTPIQMSARSANGDGEDSDAVSAADALVAMARSALAAGPVDSSGDDQHLVVLHADIGVFAGPSASAGGQARFGRRVVVPDRERSRGGSVYRRADRVRLGDGRGASLGQTGRVVEVGSQDPEDVRRAASGTADPGWRVPVPRLPSPQAPAGAPRRALDARRADGSGQPGAALRPASPGHS